MAPKSPPRKVEINYPPVPTRKWKPPHSPHDPKKKKPFVRKPEFPHTEKLHPSSLDKIWHHYRMLSKRCAILYGKYSQYHLRFPLKSRGKQGSANCFIAIGFTKMKEMDKWDDRCLQLILELGNKLYTQSVLTKKNCACTAPKDVQNSFYIHDTHLVLEIDDAIHGTFQKINDTIPCLLDTVKKILTNIGQGILEFDNKYIAIWKLHSSYYIFDPNDRDLSGKRCKESTGIAVVIKFLDVPSLVENCLENGAPSSGTKTFSLTPVNISKVRKKNLQPPENLTEYRDAITSVRGKETTKEEPKSCLTRRVIPGLLAKTSSSRISYPGAAGPLSKIPGFATKIPTVTYTRRSIPADEKPSTTPSLTVLIDPTKSNEAALTPIDKPKPTPAHHFTFVVPNKLGIIRSSYSQNDPNFSKFAGKQSLANAVAACTMLRQTKSKLWFIKLLDEILLMGETIYLDSRKNMVGDQVLDLKTITDKIKLNKKYYTPHIEANTIIGKLNSNKLNVLDLKPALEEFFSTNDTGVLRGPLTVAVWQEEGTYYMFDPNDRDQHGGAILKTLKPGTDEPNTEPGYACLIWFKSLDDLVNLYMNNLEKNLRREHFFISKIEIKNYIEKVVAWNNFVPLRLGKWIIRGRFSQNNARFSAASRNTQCTAIATLSVIYSKLIKIEEWCRDTVDEIVTEGDVFYLKCVETLKAKNKFENRMLMMAEILNKYALKDKEIILDIEECLVNGLLRTADDYEISNLKKGFIEFFRDNDSGVVTSRSLSVGVWKDEDAFYYFDSHARDERGYSSFGGAACVLRVATIEDLANIMSANLGAGALDLYNIARVDAKVLEKTEEGGIKPEFNNYTELSATKGILQANSYQGDAEKFDVLADKQTVPNIMVSIGMAAVYPSHIWTQDTMDEILNIGHELYAKSRDENYRRELDNMPNWEQEEEPKDLELVTMDNVIKEFQIGVNKVTFDFEEFTECKVEPDKVPEEEVVEGEEAEDKENVEKEGEATAPEEAAPKSGGGAAPTETAEDAPKEGEELEQVAERTLKDILKDMMDNDVSENAKNELILQNDCLDVALWKQAGLYFLFDPKGRDMQGNAIGRETWSEKVYVKVEEETAEGEEGVGDEVGAGDAPVKSSMKVPSKQASKVGPTPKTSVAAKPEAPADEPEDVPEEPEPIELDYSNAKACTILFTSIDDVSDHIIENIRPNKRDTIKIVPFKLTANPFLKVPTNLMDKAAGNWNEFQEVDNEQWILRGTMDMYNKMYPGVNRGRQFSSMCVAGCVFARLYATAKFKCSTVDNILKYGDRLHTIVRMEREKQMKKIGLTEDQIAIVLSDLNLRPSDVVKKFYLGSNMVFIEVTVGVVEGDVSVKDISGQVAETVVEEEKPKEKEDKTKKGAEKKKEEVTDTKPTVTGNDDNILSVRQGLRKFFESHNFGIITAKDISISLWKLGDMYYTFDPDSRGPYGLKEVNGTACIIRFKNIERLANIFEKNLKRHGSNAFTIDQIAVKTLDATEPKLEVPKVTALQEICEGKLILQGHYSQDNPKFRLKPNAACCTNALVALAMTLIHKVETWTRPIIDDIVTNGYNLYRLSVHDLGYAFNAWDDKLKLDLVKTEFNIGVMHVSCGYNMENMQKGILDIKSASVLNLRRGCEAFFRDQTKGIIQTDPLTLAIWTNNNLYYMFDPNPRCSNGLFIAGGTACLLVFKNIKLLTDHFISNVPKAQQLGAYTITPVEIALYETEQIKKAPVKQTDLLKVKRMDSSPSEDVVVKKKASPKKPSPSSCSDKRKSPKKTPRSPCSCLEKGKAPPETPSKEPESRATTEKKQWVREITAITKLHEQQVLEQKMRREFYDLGVGEAILRAHYSQNSTRFDKLSRNKQSLANSVVAVVMSKLHDLNTWTYKHIEIILDSGDLLYKDSFMKYKPQDGKIGLKHLLRTFYIMHMKIVVVLYKPSVHMDLEYESLYIGLMSFFMEEKAGILCSDNLTVAVFQKSGQYFMFDSHDRNTNGLVANSGAACVLRFDCIENLVTKFFTNAEADLSSKSNGQFSLNAIQVQSVESGKK